MARLSFSKTLQQESFRAFIQRRAYFIKQKYGPGTEKPACDRYALSLSLAQSVAVLAARRVKS